MNNSMPHGVNTKEKNIRQKYIDDIIKVKTIVTAQVSQMTNVREYIPASTIKAGDKKLNGILAELNGVILPISRRLETWNSDFSQLSAIESDERFMIQSVHIFESLTSIQADIDSSVIPVFERFIKYTETLKSKV